MGTARIKALLVLGAAALLAAPGCGKSTMYGWNGYNNTLYAHYKNPQKQEDFVEALRKIIESDESSGKKVPPGIYAEYGYALFEMGRPDEAATWFGKEKDAWPESKILMEKMIRNARRQSPGGKTGASPAPASPGAPAGAGKGN